MPGETHNGMQCNEFEALLFDALDQKLGAAELERFRAHARVCGKCGPMFAEVEAGQHWLKSLQEVEPPVNLVHNILAATSGVERARSIARPKVSWKQAVAGWLRPVFAPVFTVGRQPRFAM